MQYRFGLVARTYLPHAKLRLLSSKPAFPKIAGTGFLIFAAGCVCRFFVQVTNMKLMEEKILSDGKVLPGNILRVGGFLNQQIDTDFMSKAAEYCAELYKTDRVTKVLTIEASGIPLATLIAFYLGVNEVVVKKHASSNLSDNLYTAEIASFTHSNVYTAVVDKEYIKKNDRILIVDDFLACGNAIRGLMKIINQAGAELAGCVAAIEKGFQGGGDSLRAEGIRVESLAIIESMDEEKITFRKQ